MIKVALLDDHQLFRKSLAKLLTSFTELEVVFESDDGNKFIRFAKKNEVDILLLDIQMPIASGFEICKKIRDHKFDMNILIISQLTSKEAVHQIMDCGANGFFTKDSSPENLLQAIQHVMDFGFYFDLSLGKVISEAILWQNKKIYQHDYSVTFSNREIEIIRLACNEYSSKQIAEKLDLSTRTVEKQRLHIMEKTNSKNFIGVILYAIKSKAILLEEI